MIPFHHSFLPAGFRRGFSRLLTLLLSLLLLSSLFAPSVFAAAKTAANTKDEVAKQAIYQGLEQRKSEFEVPYSPTLCCYLLYDVLKEHPDLYLYVKPVFRTIESSDNQKTLIVQPEYNFAGMDIIDQIVAEAKKRNSAYDRELFLHDTLINNITYQSNSSSIEDIFIKKRCNCSGYARAFAGLCTLCGIPCQYITGNTPEGHHAYNKVTINGQDALVDVTWDDRGDNKPPIHRYFNVSRQDISENHEVDDSSFWNTCNSSSQSYYNHFGLIAHTTAEASRLLRNHPEVKFPSEMAAQISVPLLALQYSMSSNTALGVLTKY